MKRIILVLGAPNDEKGNLSRMALDRLDCALGLYACNDDVRFICTGGFGDDFNVTDKPHAYYGKQYLIQHGVREDAFLDFVLSSNTVEDFRLSKPVIEQEHPGLLMVVTSDFHMKRVKILHDIILKYPDVVFIPARSNLPGAELSARRRHEEEAIRKLRDNGFVLY